MASSKFFTLSLEGAFYTYNNSKTKRTYKTLESAQRTAQRLANERYVTCLIHPPKKAPAIVVEPDYGKVDLHSPPEPQQLGPVLQVRYLTPIEAIHEQTLLKTKTPWTALPPVIQFVTDYLLYAILDHTDPQPNILHVHIYSTYCGLMEVHTMTELLKSRRATGILGHNSNTSFYLNLPGHDTVVVRSCPFFSDPIYGRIILANTKTDQRWMF